MVGLTGSVTSCKKVVPYEKSLTFSWKLNRAKTFPLTPLTSSNCSLRSVRAKRHVSRHESSLTPLVTDASALEQSDTMGIHDLAMTIICKPEV